MFDFDIIIPCYGKSEIINRGLASIATQWKNEYAHVTLVNDCSPNTDCNYKDLIDQYKDLIDIRVIKTPKNYGQGLTRQYGIDHTNHDWFMFMDEDDRFGDNMAISVFIGIAESYNFKKDEKGNFMLDGDNKPIIDPSVRKLAIISGPVFEFDDFHSKVIQSDNRVWLNSKLYNREFINKHNIKFNKAQSRHAEDYYFTSCFFFALDFDSSYMGILLDEDHRYYLWYPNPESQSRVDPNYGYMLSGYTMNGSVNALKYMKNYKINKIHKTDKTEEYYSIKLLDCTVYSYFTFLSFLKHIKETDYVPKLELDWTILRDSCKELRNLTYKNWDKYPYIQKLENIFRVKNMSDVIYTEPWITFDDYIEKGMDEFEWTFEQLLDSKKNKKKKNKSN